MAAIARAARSVGRLARDAAGVVLSPLRRTASARSHADAVQPIRLTSKALRPGRRMPKRHAATGKNLSPPLTWSGVPKKAKSLVLICEDPDAPRARPFVHWMMWDMSPAKTRLPRAVERKRHPARTGGAVQGRNGTGKRGYFGPLPPRGHGLHHYHFQIFALDRKVKLKHSARRKALVKAITRHVIAAGELMGTYERKP